MKTYLIHLTENFEKNFSQCYVAKYPDLGDGTFFIWGDERTLEALEKLGEKYEYFDFSPRNEKFHRQLMLKLAFPTYGYNTSIYIDPDGELIELPPGQSFQNEDIFVAVLRAPGYWNEDTSVYLDGWTEELPDGRYRSDIDGKIMTLEEAIEEAILEGEWSDTFEELYRQIFEQSVGLLDRNI